MPRPRHPRLKDTLITSAAEAWPAVYKALRATEVARGDLETAVKSAMREVALYGRLAALERMLGLVRELHASLDAPEEELKTEVPNLGVLRLVLPDGSEVHVSALLTELLTAVSTARSTAERLAAIPRPPRTRGGQEDSTKLVFAGRIAEKLKRLGYRPTSNAIAYLSVVAGLSPPPKRNTEALEATWRQTAARGKTLLAKAKPLLDRLQVMETRAGAAPCTEAAPDRALLSVLG